MVLRSALAAVAFAFLLAGSAVRAGEMVVIASTLPGLAPGQIIEGAQAIEIPEGGKLTLILQSGAALHLTGPFTGAPEDEAPPGVAEPDLIAAVALLASDEGVNVSELGVTRGLTVVIPEDPWVIDVMRGGDHCVRAGGAALWRGKVGAGQSMTLKHVAQRRKATVNWPRNKETLSWPGDVPFEDGAVYLVRLGASPLPTKLVLHFVPAGLPSEARRAVWMAGKGCRLQAKALLNTIR